MQQRAKCK